MLKGTSLSPGYAEGTIRIKAGELDAVPSRQLTSEDEIREETRRFREVLQSSQDQLRDLRERFGSRITPEKARIFDVHIACLKDPVFISDVENLIQKDRWNLEAAISRVIDNFGKIFNLVENSYLKERAADLRDIAIRLLRNLKQAQEEGDATGNEPTVLVARELTLVDLFGVDQENVAGILTEGGGVTSHAAILARSIGVPTVIGIEGLLERVKDGDFVAIDGVAGTVFMHPDARVRESLRAAQPPPPDSAEIERLKLLAPVTADGVRLSLQANVGKFSEIDKAKSYDIDGIGLFRTEFLFLTHPDVPPEDLQHNLYYEAARRMEGKPITLRCLDLDSATEPAYLSLRQEPNPALGLRSLRVMLGNVAIFKRQLRALLRANEDRNIRLLIPFVSMREDLERAKELLEEAAEELRGEGVEVSMPPVAVLIEVPALAVSPELVTDLADFVVVGTDNLLQYVTASDRNNAAVAHQYRASHPAFLRLLADLASRLREAGQQDFVVCGEVAGDPRFTPFFVGIGARAMSMSPGALPRVKEILTRITVPESERLVREILKLTSPDDVVRALSRFLAEKTVTAREDAGDPPTPAASMDAGA